MKRNAMKLLIKWKNSTNRKPLLLQGARQVGKTYLLKKFGKKEFRKIHVINFEDPGLHTVFDRGPVDVEAALLRIQILLGTKIDRKNDIIFFDEIQDYPAAIHALKYFCENTPELAIVCAGSQIGISGSRSSFPVGKVHFEILHPLTYEEFLQQYNPILAASIFDAIDKLQMDEFIHKQLWHAYLMYSLVGGMPEAVVAFLGEDDRYAGLENSRQIHKTLVQGYINDFSKYCGKSMSHRITSVFQSIPGQLQAVHDQSTKRYQFKGVVTNNTKYSHLQSSIDWLCTSGLVIKVPIANMPLQPLSAYCKPNMFKLLVFDIGILNSQLNLDFGMAINQSTLSYKGFITENFVAQQIQKGFYGQIYSWMKGRSEIEYILPYKDLVIPIEVKSSIRTKAKSLVEYKKKYSPKLAIKLSGKNIRLEDGQLNAPIYLAEHLNKLINRALDNS